MARDKRNDTLLKEAGWRCLHFWEKEVLKDTDNCIDIVMQALKHQ